MPIFRVKSVKTYTGQFLFTQTPSVVSLTNMRYVCKINLGYKCALAGPVLAPDTNKSRDIAFTMINISFYGRVTGAKYGAKRG